MMKQVQLQKGTRTMMSWWPAEVAKVGLGTIAIKEDGEWDRGWNVVWVGQEAVPESSLPDAHVYRKAIKR